MRAPLTGGARPELGRLMCGGADMPISMGPRIRLVQGLRAAPAKRLATGCKWDGSLTGNRVGSTSQGEVSHDQILVRSNTRLTPCSCHDQVFAGPLGGNFPCSSVAIVPVSLLLLFKRVLERVCPCGKERTGGAGGAGEWRRQDKSRTVRHGWRGKNSLSINACPRGALSDHDVRHPQIARIHWCF